MSAPICSSLVELIFFNLWKMPLIVWIVGDSINALLLRDLSRTRILAVLLGIPFISAVISRAFGAGFMTRGSSWAKIAKKVRRSVLRMNLETKEPIPYLLIPYLLGAKVSL